MQVLKFGGSSLGTGPRVRAAAAIILDRASTAPCAVVLSAPKGVTDLLVGAIDAAVSGGEFAPALDRIGATVHAILADLRATAPSFDDSPALAGFVAELEGARRTLSAIALLQECPDHVHARLASAGERMSVAIMAAWLADGGAEVNVIDPVAMLLADGSPIEARVDLDVSRQRFADLRAAASGIHLMPGFTAGDAAGKLVILGRNGSDYSAAVLAACLDAARCEIWTDVDGVYSCDPRIVPDARLLDRLSDAEAMELSYFGAAVLHPKTIAPIARFHIPCVIKNTGNPDAPGTHIGPEEHDDTTVKGISSLGAVTMIDVAGPGLKGMVGMAARVFARMAQAGISIVLITQSSSEYTISFCVRSSEADAARAALEDEFDLELHNGLLDPLGVQDDLAIVSVIGDGMRHTRGIAAHFFSALSTAQLNVVAIAQGSSERSISAVVGGAEAARAIRAIHETLFDSQLTLDLFVVGVGNVGRRFLGQVADQAPVLADEGVIVRVCGVANSKVLALDPAGIDPAEYADALAGADTPLSIEAIRDLVVAHNRVNPLVVDCTSSEAIGRAYPDFLEAGLHVVTANKKANTADMDLWRAIRDAARRRKRRFLFETNVGGGLPVIENFQNLLRAGDRLLGFSGILSGSLSKVCGLLEDGVAFSEAVREAREGGFTEPDPRDDLSGTDVARKVLIIAREAGMALDLSDIVVQPLLPPGFDDSGDVDAFMARTPTADAWFAEQTATAADGGRVLRYVGAIEDGRCTVKLQAVPTSHALASVRDGQNALAFTTRYYNPHPLVLRGYGAGPDVTAAGLFADVLRCLAWRRDD